MNSRLSDLLDRLAPVVREEVRRDFLPNCCIATAAILRRVFRHFRFDSSPVPVEVAVRNARLVELLRRGCSVPADPDRMHHWFKSTGAYSVGITRDSPNPFLGGGFSGHLVTRVADVLVDASLDQCNRPQHGIKLPPFIVTNIALDFEAGKAQAGFVDGCEVIFQRLRGDNTWRTSPDWTNEDRARRAVNAIIERVRANERRGFEPCEFVSIGETFFQGRGFYARG
jgi:hypothetical protein